MKNRKTVVVAFLLIAAMLLGVGYAALTDTLTIIGNAHIDMTTVESTFEANIHFSDAQPTSTTGKGTKEDVASFSDDDATFTANRLAIVGDKSVFTFTIVNEGNVDAEIHVNTTKQSGAENPSNTNPGAFTVTYEYPEGYVIAAKGGEITVVVTVEVAQPILAATSATFGLELIAEPAE